MPKETPPPVMSAGEKLLCIIGIYVVYGVLMGFRFQLPWVWARLWEMWK